MGIRAPLAMSLLLLAAMAALTLWAWPQIPDGAPIVVRWGADNLPHGYMPKEIALLLCPAIAAVGSLFFTLVLFTAKPDSGLAQSHTPYAVAWISALFVFLIAHALVVLNARSYSVDIIGNLTLALGLAFVISGNFLGKTRRNRLVGIKTPWSLKSDYVWDKTHRAAGRMMVAVGLAGLLVLLTVNGLVAISVLLIGLTCFGLISVVLSYYYWRRDPARHGGTPH